jgi:hypothetical protein
MTMLLGGPVLLAAAVVGTMDQGRGQEAGSSTDESVEPPMLFTLEVGGSRHAIALEKPLTLRTEKGETVVVLRAEDHRVFPYGGVRFRYPAHFAFEADLEDPAASIWTLDGSNVVLMVQRFPGRADHDACRRDIVRATASQLGIRRPQTKETKKKLGGREIPGTQLEVAIGGTRLTMDFYSFSLGGVSVVLMLQDALGDDGGHTAEWKRTMDMLSRSLELTSPRRK